jgi:Rrf2 family iron-sulfur cluster assembly transcriptional regulator
LHLSRTDIVAIIAVVDVAIHGQQRPVAGSDVGRRYGLPQRYFEPMLRTLAERGIVTGKRGRGGGYQLARAPHFITVDDILRGMSAMQGALERSILSAIEKRIALPALEEVQMAVSRSLQGITIADLVRSAECDSRREIARMSEQPGATPQDSDSG